MKCVFCLDWVCCSFENAFYNGIMVPLELIAGFFFYPLLYLQLLFP